MAHLLRFTPATRVMLLFGIFLLGAWTPGVAGEIFSSTASLQNLVMHQDILLNNLEEYIESETNRLTEIQRMINERRKAFDEYTQNPEKVLENVKHPTAAYSLVRDWSFITDKVDDISASNNLKVRVTSVGLTLPDANDRKGAMRALIRLQRAYNLSIDDLAQGNVRGHYSQNILGGRDFFDIGVEALNTGLAKTGNNWLQKAMGHWPTDASMTDVIYWMGQSHNLMYEYKKARDILEIGYNIDKTNYTMQSQYETMVRFVENHGDGGSHQYNEMLPDWKLNYEALCRSDYTKMNTLRPDMRCEYQAHTVPYLRYKVEVMHEDPWIVLYHDVISDDETEQIKQEAVPSLSRSVVGDPANSYATEDRVSKVSWLYDHAAIPKVQELSRRVQQITGLSTVYSHSLSHSEPFQVVNYGMGGQYEPHVDVYENRAHLDNVPSFLKDTGDRIATFMFYLSHVTEGGATVFPLLNVYVPPIKNAAAFWFNIHRNGSLDLRTQHAGCPVLVGEKWVANKWIREIGQVFRRPCGPTPFSTEPESRAYKDT